jgi:hypothetical protein
VEETMNTEFLVFVTPVLLTAGFLAAAIFLLHFFITQG